MNNHRKISILVGTLYLIGFITGLLSIVPAIDAPDYLVKVSANENQVLIGALFQFAMTILSFL
jgi:hypothetical protein